jgi:cytosine/adenosine deaminase-related metal-dependent hydrolase
MLLKNISLPGRSTEIINLGTKGERITEDYSDNIELDFNGAIAFPGLVNSHDHLEFNLYPKLGNMVYKDYVEWGIDIHLKNNDVINMIERVPYELRYKWGLYKNLLCGVTTVAHHGKGKNFKFDGMPDTINHYNYLHSVQLETNWKLKLNLSFNLEPFVIHIGEGVNSNSSKEIDQLLKWNLTGRKIVGVHGISLDKKRSMKFKAVVWCPDSNLFLYKKTACILDLKKNTEILFGSDSTLSSDWNVWNHIRLARNLGCLNDQELFKSITYGAAKVWGLHSTGSLSENKIADIVISKKKYDDYWDNFYNTNPEDILLIIKRGKVIYMDKLYVDIYPFLDINDFDLIEINSGQKYIVKGIKELLQNIRKYIPGYEFPIKVM